MVGCFRRSTHYWTNDGYVVPESDSYDVYVVPESDSYDGYVVPESDSFIGK